MDSTWRWIDPLGNGEWAQLLERHPRASVFQSSGWLEALKRTYGYEPAALALRSSSGELSGGLAFCRIHSWLTGRRLVSVPFADHCDPLVHDETEREALTAALQRESEPWNYVELRPRDGVPPRGFEPVAQYWLHHLPLTADPGDMRASFHKNHIIRKIRRSEREHLGYEEGRSARLLADFYELVITTRRRHGWPPQPVAWFRNVLDCLGDNATIRVAFKNRAPIAGMMTIRFGREMTYKYGASDARFHNLGGMQLLMWRTIEDACRSGCTTLDFGRSRMDNEGEVAYKDHWGASRSPLVYWRSPPKKTVSESAAASQARRIFAYLPDALLVAAGRALYRHIG